MLPSTCDGTLADGRHRTTLPDSARPRPRSSRGPRRQLRPPPGPPGRRPIAGSRNNDCGCTPSRRTGRRERSGGPVVGGIIGFAAWAELLSRSGGTTRPKRGRGRLKEGLTGELQREVGGARPRIRADSNPNRPDGQRQFRRPSPPRPRDGFRAFDPETAYNSHSGESGRDRGPHPSSPVRAPNVPRVGEAPPSTEKARAGIPFPARSNRVVAVFREPKGRTSSP